MLIIINIKDAYTHIKIGENREAFFKKDVSMKKILEKTLEEYEKIK